MRYLIAGGVAGNLHGSVRATNDVDVLVPRDVRNAARLLEALAELPYGLARELDAETVATKPITIIGDDPRVDVLTVAATVTFDAAYPRRVVRRIAGVRVPHLHPLDDRHDRDGQRTRSSVSASIEGLVRVMQPVGRVWLECDRDIDVGASRGTPLTMTA